MESSPEVCICLVVPYLFSELPPILFSTPLHYSTFSSSPPLQPQSIILVSPLIIHLRSSLPPKRLQTNWSECKYGPSLDFCYLFYHFLRWLNSNPDIWFLNHISNLRPCVWNGNSQKISHQSSFIVHKKKNRFYAFLEASEKIGVLLFSQGLCSINLFITIFPE